jgi:predicted TPR repeat methyltransferase
MDSSLHQASLEQNNDKRTIYNQWADTYEEYVKNLNYLGPKNVAENFKDYISTFNNNNFKILDFGCGTGLLGQEIYQNLIGNYHFEIDGIDISENMIQKCREKNIYRNIIEINLLQDNLPPNYEYDYIVSSGVFLEGHVSFKVVNKLLDNLKTFGTLFITIRESFKNEQINDYQEFILQNPRLEFLFESNIEYLPNVGCKLIIVKKIY